MRTALGGGVVVATPTAPPGSAIEGSTPCATAASTNRSGHSYARSGECVTVVLG